MAGAPLGTRTAAKQSESKSKLMPNLFESRGLRRLWASHGQSFRNPVTEELPTIHELGYQFRTNFSTIHPIREDQEEKRAQL
jgi:hypothetical protein